MTALRCLHPREASIFAAFAEAVLAPATPLPPIHGTDALAALDENLAAAPAINRVGLRAGLLALELAPLALGHRHRLRRLDADTRHAVIGRLELGPAAGLIKGLRALAQLTYYGDPTVLAMLGYDADAVVRRGAELRAAEARW